MIIACVASVFYNTRPRIVKQPGGVSLRPGE